MHSVVAVIGWLVFRVARNEHSLTHPEENMASVLLWRTQDWDHQVSLHPEPDGMKSPAARVPSDQMVIYLSHNCEFMIINFPTTTRLAADPQSVIQGDPRSPSSVFSCSSLTPALTTLHPPQPGWVAPVLKTDFKVTRSISPTAAQGAAVP